MGKFLCYTLWVVFIGLCMVDQYGTAPLQFGIALFREVYGERGSFLDHKSELWQLALAATLMFVAAEMIASIEDLKKRRTETIRRHRSR